MTITELVASAHSQALKSGWWPDGERLNVPEKLALIHSEVSDCLDAYRETGDPLKQWYREDGKIEGCPSELADVLIRIGDLCGRLGIDLETAVLA